MAELEFFVAIPKPSASELRVRLQVPRKAAEEGSSPAGLTLFLPTWTPGSYLIREYSRHIAEITARDVGSGSPLRITKSTKNRWAVDLTPTTRMVEVEYLVYCHELSVRTADVTTEHAFWNNTCVLLWPMDQRDASATITVRLPSDWELATALSPLGAARQLPDGTKEIAVRGEGMERVYDCPMLAGRLRSLHWHTAGVPHSIVFDGLVAIDPPEPTVADLGRIVGEIAAMFGGTLPYERYAFLCLMTQDGHGGLEHWDSTVLLHSRTQLRSRKGYLEFQSLAAHELFHAWNVKRLRPREFVELDYERENYTRMLWLMEGWTAYYDDLVCVRAGVSTIPEYLAAAGKNVQSVLGNPGRLRFSLADSSFDAWIRLYRPDENTRNSSQNYYGNGAALAMCLDLLIRRESEGRASLDDVLRSLYESCPPERGYDASDVEAAVQRLGGQKALTFLKEMTEGPLEPPIADLLASHGVALHKKDTDQPHLGVQFEAGGTVIASVNRNASAWNAGLMPGDEILAVQGLRVDAARWQEVFQTVAVADQPIDVLIARRGVIKTLQAIVSKSPGTASLELLPNVDDSTRRLRELWLTPSRRS